MSSKQAKSADEVLGLEYDWLANDGNGCVAVFTTAGGAYAHEECLRDTDAHDEAIDATLAMQVSTQARFAPNLPPGLKNTWRMMAERGLFAFDSDSHGGPYRQVAAPVEPIQIADLPRRAIQVVRALTLCGVRFQSHSIVAADLLRGTA